MILAARAALSFTMGLHMAGIPQLRIKIYLTLQVLSVLSIIEVPATLH